MVKKFFSGKSAQVTVFIILGLILLVSVGLFLFITNQFNDIDSTVDVGSITDSDAVKLFIENCLSDTSYEALSIVLANGGYYQTNDQFIDFGQFLSDSENYRSVYLPYYFTEGESTLPTIETIASELALGVEDLFEGCVDDFSAFKDQGFTFESSAPIVTVEFLEGGYNVDLDYSLVLHNELSSQEYSHFDVFIGFDFLDKYQRLVGFLDLQEENPEYFSIGKFSSIIKDTEDYFDYQNVGDNGNELLLNMYYHQENEDDLVHTFVLSFSWDDLTGDVFSDFEFEAPEINESNRLILFYDEEWNINEPGVYNLQIETNRDELENGFSDADLIFSVSPDTLDINPETGLITLDTREYSNGVYSYFIGVEDSNNRSTEAPLVINLNVNDGSLAQIEELSEQVFYVGDEVNLTLNVLNKDKGPYFYVAETDLFEINKQTGEFSFIVTEDLLGDWQVYFTMENQFGLSWYLWNFEVLEDE